MFALTVVAGCDNSDSSEQSGISGSEIVESTVPDSLNILFIGNSLTYTNNLPRMLEVLLTEAGIDVERMESHSYPNFGLPDHWANSQLAEKITAGGWDVVILQQGPSATEGRPYLLEYVDKYAELITQGGAEVGVYMVWPAQSRFFDFDGVSDSYQTAAENVDGMLFPAGEAWREAWKVDSSINLYGPDRFHPSAMGTYLAALVMYEQLSNLDPRELPPEIPIQSGKMALDEEIAAILQQAAVDANAEFAIP